MASSTASADHGNSSGASAMWRTQGSFDKQHECSVPCLPCKGTGKKQQKHQKQKQTNKKMNMPTINFAS